MRPTCSAIYACVMFSGVFRILSLKLKWIIGTIVVTVLGYSLLLHGGVNLDSAIYTNQTTWVYQLELYISLVLLWPISIYGWFYTYLTDSTTLGLEIWFIQFFGYGVLYFTFKNWCSKKT